TRHAAVAGRDDDHAVGLHNREAVGRRQVIVHGVAHPLRRLRIALSASVAAAAHAAAISAAAVPPHPTAAVSAAPPALAVALILCGRRRIARVAIEGPRAGNRFAGGRRLRRGLRAALGRQPYANQRGDEHDDSGKQQLTYGVHAGLLRGWLSDYGEPPGGCL